MFEYSPPVDHSREALPEVQSSVFNGWVEYLGTVSGNRAAEIPADSELIDQLRTLEELKAAAAAAQARIAAAFDASQRRIQAQAGERTENLGRGVASQVALARRESPNKGGRLLGFAKALTTEMPYTLQALSLGKISEWRATLLVRETACLSAEDRRRVDKEVAGDLPLLETLGDRQIIARTKTAAYRLDPRAAVNRAAKAASERFVSCRPAPDTMTYLTGLLPVAQGVGVFAALSREADRLRAAGDPRGRGQIMADTLVERVTGQAEADRMKVEIHLVMTDRTLLAGDSEPALIPGYGPVPAQWARDLVRNRNRSRSRNGSRNQNRNQGKHQATHRSVGGSNNQAERWIRRLYTTPGTNELVAMDSRARLFPSSLARFIAVRDQTCRMPWCGAPIRHFDHIQPHSRGGPTSAANGQGLCEACNQAKEAPGWSAAPVKAESIGAGTCAGVGASKVDTDSAPAGAGFAPAIITITPTGHSYRSTPPPLPGKPPAVSLPKEDSPFEACLTDLIRAA